MDAQVPLIGTRTTGPLGIVHLPRLWLKMRLAAKDRLGADLNDLEGWHDFHLALLEA